MGDDDDAVGFLVTHARRRGDESAHDAGECPGADALASLAEGSLAEAAPGRDALERHLSSCGACRGLVAALAGASPEPVPAGAGGQPPASPDARAQQAPDAANARAATELAPARAPGDESFPRTLGPYTVLRRIGSGGMGVVYEAVHRTRKRREALKVLKGGLGASPDMVARFEREVEAMAGLVHDHIVGVYDSGTLDGDIYYTMPLVSGPSLSEVLRAVKETGESPPGARACQVLDGFHLPPAARAGATPEETYCLRAAASLVGVADALAAMHARGILHRDVKPGNLLTDERGRVLLADFGLVRWGDRRITRTGESLGTPAYMSPEQVISDGEDPDGRSDVYALGATLFELLTLRLPHEADSGLETVRAKLSRRVAPVRSHNPAVPEDLETLVGRCLERRREDRVPSAAVLRDELRRFTRGEPVRTRPVSSLARAANALRRHRVPWGIAAAVLLATGAWHFTRPTLLTVTSIPPASVWLDGKEVATTPLAEFSVSPGEHEIRLVRERFATFVRPVSLPRGARLELDRTLQPEDPADPVAIRVLAAAVGLQVSDVRVTVTRSAGGGPAFQLLFPRGRTLRAPAEIRLWAADIAEGWRAVLEPAAGGEPVASWDLEPALPGRAGLPLPDAARTRLDEGGEFVVRLLRPGGAEAERATFTVVDASARRRVEEEWEGVRRRFPDAGPAVSYLEVEFLLARGLHEEAYDRAAALSEDADLGPRRETARVALAALDAAGLRDRGWWGAWVERHSAAER